MTLFVDKSPDRLSPDYAVPPGRTLQETIEALGIDQNELAKRTGLTPKTVNLIIKGKAPLSQHTAILLECATNVPARLWNNLECNYREQVARLASSKQLENQVTWLRKVPTKELIRRGFLKETSDRVSLLEQSLKFFGVASVEAWNEGWSDGQFGFRKSVKSFPCDVKLASWLRIAEIEGQHKEVERFNREQFVSVAKASRELMLTKPTKFIPQLVKSFASVGVALCFVPEIPGAKISGAAKWLSPEKALIAINLLGKRNDTFWFTLFHEVGHVLSGSKKATYLDISYSEDSREKSANEFAWDLLIPPVYKDQVAALKTREQIVSFASMIRIAPGVLVGRLQYDKLLPHTNLNDLKEIYVRS